MHPRSRVALILSAVAAMLGAQLVWAQLKSAPGDWPAWRGPDRTGVSTEKGLLQEWPKGGPKQLWKITGLGNGYSTPTVAAGRLYVIGTKGSSEVLHCLDVKDGSKIWAADIGSQAKAGYAGPRSTPTVDGDRIYTISSSGDLACFSTAKGESVWKKSFSKDFSGQRGGWAYAESPLIDGDRLVCTPGGSSATMVCLEKKDGKEIWRSAITGVESKAKTKKGKGGRSFSTAAYSSAIVAEAAGEKQYVQFLSGGVVGVSAKDGKFLWHYDAPANGTANASTVLFQNDAVFAASGYGTGGGKAKISKSDDGKFKAEQDYFVSTLQNHHGGMVLVDGYIYGTNNSSLLCVEFKTGKVMWTARSAGKGSVMFADGHIYHRGEDGTMCLVEATPTGHKEKGRFTQPDRSTNKAWAYPTVAGGKLYLRDWDALLCYEIKAAN